jgi:hypothetical protein
MPHYYCPCGSLLERISSARSLRSPCLRLFVSIKTMQVVSSETKVCESCRGAYYSWKQNNPEFAEILSRVEQEVSNDVEVDVNSNAVKIFLFETIVSFVFL